MQDKAFKRHQEGIRMREYKILESELSQELAEKVTQFIEAGWKPSGSLVIVPYYVDEGREEFLPIYAQAMTL